MTKLSTDQLKELAAKYPDDPAVAVVVKRLMQAEYILDKALYEFGGDIRMEIERFLGEPHLIPPTEAS